MKQEDGRLITLLDAAITAYASINPLASTGNVNQITATGVLTPSVFYDAVANVDEHELESARLGIRKASIQPARLS